MSLAKYDITIDTIKKVFLIQSDGFFSVEDGQALHNLFKEKVATIDATQYTLLINAKNNKTVSADVVPIMQKTMELYQKTPFKHKFAIVDSVVAKSQIKRVGDDSFTQEIQFVSSAEEAYKLMG